MGERRAVLHAGSTTGVMPLIAERFIPQRYEPNYAYPLLVMLHGRGGTERQLLRAMPSLSWRNYIAVGLRGPETVARRDGEDGFGWGDPFGYGSFTPKFHRPSPGESVRRSLEPTPAEGSLERIEDGLIEAVQQARRSLHVHSERIFLVGMGEGAAVAYRLGLMYPERFAGVVAINGWVPSGFAPLGRFKACRNFRMLVIHGEWNERVPVEEARHEVSVFRNAGLRVAFQSYPCGHRLRARMLADVDAWLIHQCTTVE